MSLSNEQRAHDLAIESMKMIIELSKSPLFKRNDDDPMDFLEIYKEQYLKSLDFVNENFPKKVKND